FVCVAHKAASSAVMGEAHPPKVVNICKNGWRIDSLTVLIATKTPRWAGHKPAIAALHAKNDNYDLFTVSKSQRVEFGFVKIFTTASRSVPHTHTKATPFIWVIVTNGGKTHFYGGKSGGHSSHM
ncbi:MAG: hypothetical protein AAGG69_03375, partial [Pseudomonadota bacterium]